MRGMGLYPAWWETSSPPPPPPPPPPPAAGLLLAPPFEEGDVCVRGHSEAERCSCRVFSSASRDEGWRPLTVCSASGVNSRGSCAAGLAWCNLRCWASNSRIRCCDSCCARSHCSCWRRFACVGRSCSSGGRRGSGLYMVASQGASPSGRLMAVAGRGSSPERDLGLEVVEGGVRGVAVVVDIFRGFWLIGVVSRPERDLGRWAEEGVRWVFEEPGRFSGVALEAEVGVWLGMFSMSSRRMALPTLLLRLRTRE